MECQLGGCLVVCKVKMNVCDCFMAGNVINTYNSLLLVVVYAGAQVNS